MSGAVTEQPYSARVFGLPMTHVLEHQSADSDENVNFLIWCLGFLLGLRLTNTEAGFLDATPIKAGTLHDIVWFGKDSIPKALGFADQFWGGAVVERKGPEGSNGDHPQPVPRPDSDRVDVREVHLPVHRTRRMPLRASVHARAESEVRISQ